MRNIHSVLKVQFNDFKRGKELCYERNKMQHLLHCNIFGVLLWISCDFQTLQWNPGKIHILHHTLCVYFVSTKPFSQVFLFSVILCSQDKIPSSHLPDWRRHTTTHPAHTPCQRQRKGRYVFIWTELALKRWWVISDAFYTLLFLCRLWVQYVLTSHPAPI